MQCEQQLANDGVVLLENVLSQSFIDRFSAEYANFDATLCGEEKTKDPLVVFWKHVEGELKRTVSLKKCPILESFILNDLVRNLNLSISQNKQTPITRVHHFQQTAPG